MGEIKPKIFIGSSKEKQNCAEELQEIISEWSNPEIWADIFTVSKSTIESLEAKLPQFDMCVFLWTSDDIANIRGQNMPVARDNLIFETGLSYAYIGRQNTVIVREENTKVVSDLYGITDIIHDFSLSIRILATKLRKHYDEIKNISKSFCAERITRAIKGKLDFENADKELSQFGSSIRRKLENHMLDDEQEEFVNCLKKYVTKDNVYIFAEDFHNIASLCISMGLYPHALSILEYAYDHYSTYDDIVIKLIETYTNIDNPDNKVKAKEMMESYFCIKNSEDNMPFFTTESKGKHIAQSSNLQKIFKVYLMDNEYDKLLNIIASYEELNIQAKNNMVINSYKAFARWHKGDYDEAIDLYKELVRKYPNEEDMINLGIMFFDTGEIEKGYQIYELVSLAWFDYDALIRLAYRMAEHRICRTKRGLESTRASKHYAKKVIVPILFKAIDLSPNEDNIRRVKRILRGIGGRDEFEFIQKHNHVPHEMFNILVEERSKFYDWSNLDYIETEKLNQDNITELNRLLDERTINIIQETQETTLITGEV